MLVRFLKSASISHALAYVKGPTNSTGGVRDVAPVLQFGDEDMLVPACESSPIRCSHNSIALCYTENRERLSLETQKRHLEQLSALTRGGLSRCRVPDVAYTHPRCGGSDSHLLQANFDLMTGRQLPIWSPTKAQIDLYSTWRRMTNLQDDLTDPDDPWHKRFLSKVPRSLPATCRNEYHTLDYSLTVCAEDGWIRSREELIEAIEVRGYKVSSVDKASITVIGRAGARFTYFGAKYTAEFDFEELIDARRTDPFRNPERVGEEISALRQKLELMKEQRNEYFDRRFGMLDLDPMSKINRRFLDAFSAPADLPQAEATASSVLREAAAIHGQCESPDDHSVPLQNPENTNYHERNHQESNTSEIDRICQRRALRARETLHGIGTAISEVESQFRGALAASDRFGECVEESIAATSECARLACGLYQSVEEFDEPSRNRRNREELQRTLERGACDLDRARGYIEQHLALPDAPYASMRNPATGVLRFDLIPVPTPKKEFQHDF